MGHDTVEVLRRAKVSSKVPAAPCDPTTLVATSRAVHAGAGVADEVVADDVTSSPSTAGHRGRGCARRRRARRRAVTGDNGGSPQDARAPAPRAAPPASPPGRPVRRRCGQELKSSGRTVSRNWRNSPTSSSGFDVLAVLVLVLGREQDPLGVHELVGHVQRAPGAHGQGHGVRRAGRHVQRARPPFELQLGEVRGGAQFGDDDALEVGPERLDHVAQQVVGHGPRRGHALDGEGDGRRFGGPDEDRQRPAEPLGLGQEQHGRVGLQVHPYRAQPHLDHA